MSTTRLALFLALLVVGYSQSANAGIREWIEERFSGSPVNYGYWSCTGCYIPSPSEPTSTTGLADIKAFIEASNNDIHESKNERVHRWIPNSSITVCNSGGVCVTVYYQSGTVLWMPRAPSFPQPPGVQLKQPTQQPVTQTQPAGTIALDPIGPVPDFSGSWAITVPYIEPRELTPSVTVIQYSNATTYIGPSFFVEPIGFDVGFTLDWGFESSWLDPTPWNWFQCPRGICNPDIVPP